MLWKQKEIWPGISTSDEFNYHDFNATTVKKVEAKAQKKGYRTILQSAIATLTCHGPTKAIDAVCSEPEEWANICKLVGVWTKEKRNGVTVRISYIYDSKEQSSGGSSEESQAEPKAKKPRHQTDEDISDSDDILDSSESTISTNSEPIKKKDKKDKKRVRNSTTAKQEKKALERRAIEKQHGHHGHKLMKRWLCDSHQCQNRTHYCWQPHGPDDIAGKHFRLNTQDITRWNSALGKRKRGVTVEAPSEGLQRRLIRFHELAYSARKKKPESEVQSIASPSPGMT